MNNCIDNVEEMYFYKCEICGNVIIKLHNSGITPQCCSRTMLRLTSSDHDGALEKHLPAYTCDGKKLNITVGSTPHPMEEDHYIEWILVQTNKGFHVKFLSPSDVPEAVFRFCMDERVEYIYSYCNVHGLWKVCALEDTN